MFQLIGLYFVKNLPWTRFPCDSRLVRCSAWLIVVRVCDSDSCTIDTVLLIVATHVEFCSTLSTSGRLIPYSTDHICTCCVVKDKAICWITREAALTFPAFNVLKESTPNVRVWAFKHDTNTRWRVIAFNYTVSNCDIVRTINADSVFRPGYTIFHETIEAIHHHIVTELELDNRSTREWTSRIFPHNSVQLRPVTGPQRDASWTSFCQYVAKYDVLGVVNSHVCAFKTTERTAAWARLSTPRISVCMDFNIFNREIVTVPAEYAHSVGRVVDDHVSDCHIVSNDFEGVVLCSVKLSRRLSDDNQVLDYRTVLPDEERPSILHLIFAVVPWCTFSYTLDRHLAHMRLPLLLGKGSLWRKEL